MTSDARRSTADTFEATLYLKPHAMKRPRTARDGHVYSPSAGYVEMFQQSLRNEGFHKWAERHQGESLEVQLGFVLQRPKKTKFKDPTSKRHGDVDNHIKTLLDAINGFIPDEQVIRVTGEKSFGDTACVEVWVSALGWTHGTGSQWNEGTENGGEK